MRSYAICINFLFLLFFECVISCTYALVKRKLSSCCGKCLHLSVLSKLIRCIKGLCFQVERLICLANFNLLRVNSCWKYQCVRIIFNTGPKCIRRHQTKWHDAQQWLIKLVCFIDMPQCNPTTVLDEKKKKFPLDKAVRIRVPCLYNSCRDLSKISMFAYMHMPFSSIHTYISHSESPWNQSNLLAACSGHMHD